MGMYFSILLDIKPENFDHTIHQAIKGTSGFLFCKTQRTDGFETYQKDICTILNEPLTSSDSGTTIEEDQKQEDQKQSNIDTLPLVTDEIDVSENQDDASNVISLQKIRIKIEDLSPHIQIQKV